MLLVFERSDFQLPVRDVCRMKRRVMFRKAQRENRGSEGVGERERAGFYLFIYYQIIVGRGRRCKFPQVTESVVSCLRWLSAQAGG